MIAFWIYIKNDEFPVYINKYVLIYKSMRMKYSEIMINKYIYFINLWNLYLLKF